ncbi:MAG: hypothetical protein ACI82A_004450 [Candidatus Azotimanducaceae bacterium]|jgi:hypothetical protein
MVFGMKMYIVVYDNLGLVLTLTGIVGNIHNLTGADK